MIRPQKKCTNRLIDQWEQNLLLKVMERKIKTAKSTIPVFSGARRSHPEQSTPAILKPRNTCSLQWNFSDLKRRLPLVRASNHNPKTTDSLPPRQLNQREITVQLKDKKQKELVISPTEPNKQSVTVHEFKDGDEVQNSSSVSGTDVETVDADVSDGFLTDEFEDTDDDLLSQLWTACKREDSLLDDAPLPKQRRVGSTTTAVIYLNSTTLPDGSKLNPSKENRPSKLKPSKENRSNRTLSFAKTSKVRETQMFSKIMKKREDGWRE